MIRDKLNAVISEISNTLTRINSEEMEEICELVDHTHTVFVAGAGRSGFMMRAFAMRLMHLGIEAYYLGESITPSAKANDVLIIGSGSGETSSLKGYVAQAKKIGLKIALITSSPESSLKTSADAALIIPAPTPKRQSGGGQDSSQPMANLFEQCLLISCDTIVMRLMEKKKISAKEMFQRHANLE